MVNYIWENIFKKTDEEANIRQFLKDNFLFQDLSRSELRFIEKVLHSRTFQPTESIFKQGEMGVGMYMILKGQVNIYTNEDSPEGHRHQSFVTRLVEGDFFGELSLIENNSRRTAAAVSYQECLLLGFFKPDLMEILDRNPAIGAKILFRLGEVLGRRLKETTEKISGLKRELREIQLFSEDVEGVKHDRASRS